MKFLFHMPVASYRVFEGEIPLPTLTAERKERQKMQINVRNVSGIFH